jgi:CubicO group peptidase (beta-lactamase class C family)
MKTSLSRREFLKLGGATGLLAFAPVNAVGDRVLAPQARVWTASGHVVPELSGFDTAVRSFMQARSISGGALAVTRNGRLVLARGYTYSDDPQDLLVQPASLFRIASLSKPVTAAAVLRLVQEGRLSLDDKVVNRISLTPPAGQTPDPRLANVTIRHLLQHLGGWNRDLAYDPMFRDAVIATAQGTSLPISQAHILAYMTGQPMQSTPGTTYSYSNYGYCLLGRVISAVTGKSYPDAIQQLVWRPLSLLRPTLGRTLPAYRRANEVKYYSGYDRPTVFNSTGTYVPSPYGGWNLENMDANGGWLASAVDMVRLAASFDDPATSPILNPASIATMFGLPQNITPGSYTPGDWYYGCGWLVRDWGGTNRNTWHEGSLDGTYTLVVRRGSDRTNWCVLFNQRDDASGLPYNAIDDTLHAAANAVTTWPTHDLFPEYLAKSTYIPLVAR